ncbi:MAG: TolC family protein [Bacteroidetes bacterium]|nr:TolC family protein [Bacteroidota bacterium]
MLNNLLLAILLMTSLTSWSQEKTAYTLSEAKEYALENHLTIKNASLDIQSAISKKNETRGIGLPQMNLQGTFNNFINLPVQVVDASFINPNAKKGETVSFRAGTDFSAAGTFQVNQILFNGSYLVGLQVSKQYVEFSRTLESQSKEEVVFSVIQAYNTVVIATENLRFIDSLLRITEELVEKQANYFEIGLLKQEDMDQLNYSLLIAKNAKTSADIQFKNSLVLLKLTMNFPLEKELLVIETSENLINKGQKANGRIENNLGLQILNKQKALNDYSLKNEKFANLPTLNGFFQHTYNAYRNEFDFFSNNQWFPQTFWGLQLNVPVFSGGQRHYKIQQAEIVLQKNENQIMLMSQTLKMQEIQSQNNLSAALEQLDLQKANVDLAEKIYRNAIIMEKIGSQNSVVVTQKYNQVIQAQAQLTAAKISVFNEQLNLEKLYNQLITKN